MKDPWQRTGRTYIIAEIGNNHNGNTETALEMIREFARTGVDAVKFQAFQAEDIVSPLEPMRDAHKWDPKGRFDRWIDFARTLELPVSSYGDLIADAHDNGLDFVVTPTSPRMVGQLSGLPIDIMKIASMDVTNLPLLTAVASTRLPSILSTGMADQGEIKAAIDVLEAGCAGVSVLHCSSVYPLPDDHAHLATIPWLRRHFGKDTGYSDHTTGIDAAAAAVACGAVIVEKHVTLDKQSKLPGEHFFSIEPHEMQAMVAHIRAMEVLMGEPQTDLTPSEQEAAKKFRRSLMLTRPLAAGEHIDASDLCCLRPGTGLSPFNIQQVIGKRAMRDLEAYQPLKMTDLK